jgi:SPP1 gp7 family putative phage head morphogenesis protein
VAQVSQALVDKVISYQLDINRLDAGLRMNVLMILGDMQTELIAQLANVEFDSPAFNRARKVILLRDITEIIHHAYKIAELEMESSLEAIAGTTAGNAHQMVASVWADAKAPTDAVVKSLSKKTLIQGGLIADWWGKLSEDAAFKVGNAIRQGIAQGETSQQIITRVAGNSKVVGVLQMAKQHASALVQTSVHAVANDARLTTFEKNADVAPELQWVATLDGHTCAICMALDGKRWTNNADGTHEPVGHAISFQSPPIHWNDRCVLIPVTKTFEEMGIDYPEPPTGTRASSIGQVSAKTTFEDYLSRLTVAQQDEMLGKGRAAMWRGGKISLNQLIDGTGRELTLAELQAKYGYKVSTEESVHLFSDALSKGGFTYKPQTNYEPKAGFAVSPFPELSWATPVKDFKITDIGDYVDRNKEALAKQFYYVGGWYDSDTGKVVLDVSIVTPTEKMGRAIAEKYDQKAIFDLLHKTEIMVNKTATSGGVL